MQSHILPTFLFPLIPIYSPVPPFLWGHPCSLYLSMPHIIFCLLLSPPPLGNPTSPHTLHQSTSNQHPIFSSFHTLNLLYIILSKVLPFSSPLSILPFPPSLSFSQNSMNRIRIVRTHAIQIYSLGWSFLWYTSNSFHRITVSISADFVFLFVTDMTRKAFFHKVFCLVFQHFARTLDGQSN